MRIAKMQKHSSGHWRVRINGKCYYLGKDKDTAERKYRELITEHYGIATNSQFRGNCITVGELLEKYITEKLRTASAKWRKTREHTLSQMMGPAVELYGDLPANDFGPKAFKMVRQMMSTEVSVSSIEKSSHNKRSVSYVNGLASILKAAFKWGVSEELVSVETYQRLQTVPGLHPGDAGLSNGREVHPVSESHYRATLPFLSGDASDFIQLLWLSGCRPGELIDLTPDELAKEGEYYVYRPKHHKTSRKNKLRAIVFGAEGVAILRRHWPAEQAGRFFSMFGSAGAVRNAVYRACDRGKLERWHPYQLRHAALTRISLQHGKDVAQAVGGHAKSVMTDHYDAGNVERAKRAAG